MSEIYTCAECGHLHFLGREEGYCECPIEGCDCEGQEWAHSLVASPRCTERQHIHKLGTDGCECGHIPATTGGDSMTEEQELQDIFDRVYEGCLRMDTATLLRMDDYRRNALARMQEHELPRVIINRQEAMVSATRRVMQIRGLL